MAQIPRSLRRLLGDDPRSCTPEMLSRLLGLAESQELDFKREVSSAKGQKADIARDAVALANGGGGLLVIGVEEDGLGRADALTGIGRTGTENALHFEQLLLSKVSPRLDMTVVAIDVGSGRDVVLVAVEGGPGVPHAVLERPKTYSYPVRAGSGNDYLSEAQVADAYARRLATSTQRDEQLVALHGGLVSDVSLTHQAWLVVSMMPSRVGVDRLRSSTLRDYRNWLNDWDVWPGFPAAEHSHANISIGHRSVTFQDGAPSLKGTLLMDGAGAGARSWMTGADDTGAIQGSTTLGMVAGHAIGLIGLLAEHARRRNAGGTASFSAQIVASAMTSVGLLPPGYERRHLITDVRKISGNSPTAIRSVDLDDLPTNGTALVQAAHLLTTDLANAYGHIDIMRITEDGRINGALPPEYGWDQHVAGWARKWGVQVTEASAR